MSFTPPAEVATVAEKALELRRSLPPSRRGGTPVGVARARDLANRKELSVSTIKRMVSFFARHEVDKEASGFHKGGEGYPSKGRIAWDLWGGDPGKTWANKMLRQIKSDMGVSEMIDVNVLTGAQIRRVDGKLGHITKVSLPWVTVEWADGKKESFLRSDEDLSENIELKTLDKGWIPLGTIVGISEADDSEEVENADHTPTDESTQTIGALLAEVRMHARAAFMSEAKAKRKAKAKKKTKELLKKKKAAKKAGGDEGGGGTIKKTNPFRHKGGTYSALGTYTKPILGKNVKRKKRNRWSCKKGKGGQVCTALTDIPDQGIKAGTEKTIRTWAKKDAYRDKYDASRASGDSRTPDGKEKPVSHRYY